MIKIVNGDCRTALKEFAPFDMLIADPPYGDTSAGRQYVGTEIDPDMAAKAASRLAGRLDLSVA